MSVAQLVELFTELSVDQDMALLSLAQREVNKLIGASMRSDWN